MSLALFGQSVADAPRGKPKPEVKAFRVNGKVRVAGVKECALWLQVSQTTVRDIAAGPEKCKRYSAALIARVLHEFPMLKDF